MYFYINVDTRREVSQDFCDRIDGRNHVIQGTVYCQPGTEDLFNVYPPSCTFWCYTPHGFICFLKFHHLLHFACITNFLRLSQSEVIVFQIYVEKDYFSWIKNMVCCIIHHTLKSNGFTKNSKATICCFEINVSICCYWQAMMLFG